MASFIRKNDKEVANRDADQWAIGYSYALSKRTSTYVAYAKIKTKTAQATPLVTTPKLVRATKPSTWV
jgi:predicted porin